VRDGRARADYQQPQRFFERTFLTQNLSSHASEVLQQLACNTAKTDIKVVGFREGKATSKHPIALLARNQMPEAVCQECGQPAKWLCIECLYEEDKPGHLCDDHVEDHPHDNYGEPMPLFNSPRTAMCGYDGPAEPPY